MSTFRKLLLSLLLVSLTGSAFGAGTFASFTASTTNAGSTFAAGSLVLSNKVAAATACLSSGVTPAIGDGVTDAKEDDVLPNVSTCDALFDGLTAHKPGQSASVNLTLQNVGNIAGSKIEGLSTGCAPGNSALTAYQGSGDPCGYVQIKVEETGSDFGAVTRCVYDGDGPGAGACGAGGTLTAFHGSHSGTPITLATPADVAVDGLRYLKITLTFPDSLVAGAENIYMGRTAAFGIKWTLTQ